MEPPQNRFLFVDIAALRAKQLRRGAVPRIDLLAVPATVGAHGEAIHKPERVAMEEVRRGLVPYTIPAHVVAVVPDTPDA
ncbi:MAG TPA: DNA-directed RNA polymerase subunit omega [Vicinamibacterales bacterium]|nr:DNA-directed RNA polymerase subunit omega [Vicinamibacterales bacterium]